MGLLQDKVAIVTGGSSGMGAATVRLFAEEGALVVSTDLAAPGAEALSSGRVEHYAHDVGDEARWEEIVAAVLARHGRIDVLVNNAGIVGFGGLLEQSLADFERVIRTNLVGTWLGMRAVGRAMVDRGGGAIVNISSTAGFSPTNGASAYAGSKWGVRGLSRVAALELGYRGVRVNVVMPGLMDTPLTNPNGGDLNALPMAKAIPLQRAGMAVEVARASLYLASDQSSYCNGAELVVDGGGLAGRYVPGFPGAPG